MSELNGLQAVLDSALQSPQPDLNLLITLRDQLERIRYGDRLPLPLLELSPSREVEYWVLPLDCRGGELDQLLNELTESKGHFIPVRTSMDPILFPEDQRVSRWTRLYGDIGFASNDLVQRLIAATSFDPSIRPPSQHLLAERAKCAKQFLEMLDDDDDDMEWSTGPIPAPRGLPSPVDVKIAQLRLALVRP